MPRHQAQRSLQDIFQEISRTLDRPDIIRTSPDKQPQKVHKNLTRQRTLLIVDNLETIEDKQGILSFLYELPANVKVIITTRERQSITPIRLTELPESQGLQLIKQKAGEMEVELDEEQEKALYHVTGGIPAAILYTIGQISTGYSVQTVLNRTKSASGDVARFCFKGSVELLQGKPSHHFLMAISIFPKSPIRDALAHVAGYTDPILIEEGLVQLQRLSFVTQSETRYSLLPLTREFALAELAIHSNFREEAMERWVEWYQNFVQKYGGSTRYKEEWYIDYNRLEDEWENIQEVLNWCIEQDRYNDFKSLWDNVRNFTNIYGYWRVRLTCSDWLVQAAGRRGDLSTVMERLSEKGRVLYKMGRLDEALSFLKEAWTFREHNDDPVLTNRIAGRISETLLLQEKYDEATEWLDRAKVIIETQLTEERKRRELSFTIYRQAFVCYKTKNYEKAEAYLQTVIKEAQALQWQRSAMLAQELLTEVKIAQGKLDEAKLSSETGFKTAIRNNDKRLIAYYKRAFALLAKKSSNYAEMRHWASEALDDFERLGAIHEADELKVLLEE